MQVTLGMNSLSPPSIPSQLCNASLGYCLVWEHKKLFRIAENYLKLSVIIQEAIMLMEVPT